MKKYLMILIFMFLVFVLAFSKLKSEFYWESERLFKGAGVTIEMDCIDVLTPLSILVKTDSGIELELDMAGISILKSVEAKKSEEVLNFVKANLIGKRLFISHIDYNELDLLDEYIFNTQRPEVLVWIYEKEEVLWNLAMILNGYAQVKNCSGIMAGYIKVCGCQ